MPESSGKGFDYDEMFKIELEARLETASRQELKRSKKFFRPRFRSVNHLHHHGSVLLDHPLAIILEIFYRLYERIRDRFYKFKDTFFRRSSKIYGDQKDCTIVGKITFAQREDHLKPVHHIHMDLWGRTWLGFYRKFAIGFTDKDGKFCLDVDMKEIHSYNLRKKLHLEIFHTGEYTFEDGKAKPKYELFKCIMFSKKEVTGMEFNLGVIQLFYWEYMKGVPYARVVIKDHDEDAPQKYPSGRVDAISEQFIPIELINKENLLKIKNDEDGDGITMKEIQESFPINVTYEMENHKPGITRSDQWFGERMMNGMSSSTFDRDPENPDQFWIHHHWRSYAHDDSEYALHNVTMKFKLNDEGYMLPTEIQLKGRLHKDSDPNQVHTLKPGDGVRWEGAKRMARVSAGLLTEIDKHFAGTHLNTEQYAIAAYRNIRQNPIGAVLFPHVKEVILINHTAYQILVNPEGYICTATALKGEGLGQRVLDVMGTLDWKNWRPMDPISDKHTYAKAANIYYNILTEYIDEFVESHMEEIIDEWHELYAFSNDVFEHGPPAFLCRHLQKATGANPHEGVTHKAPEWYNTSNRMDLDLHRDHFKEEHKAVSRIIYNEHYNPDSDDLKNLKEVCAYIIHNATFEHFWANSKQYDDIGEFIYCSLGLRYGSTEDGVLGPESDLEIAPDRAISSQMMWWSNMLSRTGYGFIMTNEDNDINPKLIEKLKAKEKEFDKLGVSIYDIQSRTNI